jgi:hypothetical protein
MPDLEMDYQTSVAQDYELRRLPKLDAPSVKSVGKSKLVRPVRGDMDYAVKLLLRTPLPELQIHHPDPLIAPKGQRTVITAEQLEAVRSKLIYPEADQIAPLEQSALAIARRIGLLGADLNRERPYVYERESMWDWFRLAQNIQEAFSGRLHGRLPISWEHPVANLSVYLSYRLGRPRSMSVRPASTGGALMYHAAQMAVSGTRAQACKSCNAPFLIGGPRSRGKKKSGTRFCSDQCRWDYNNERRKKG